MLSKDGLPVIEARGWTIRSTTSNFVQLNAHNWGKRVDHKVYNLHCCIFCLASWKGRIGTPTLFTFTLKPWVKEWNSLEFNVWIINGSLFQNDKHEYNLRWKQSIIYIWTSFCININDNSFTYLWITWRIELSNYKEK